jgi:hypothetical protein
MSWWQASPTPMSRSFKEFVRLIEVGDLSHSSLGKALVPAVSDADVA